MMHTIDSLLHIEHNEKADSLLKILENKKLSFPKQKLRLQYLRGYHQNAIDDNYPGFKFLLKIPEQAEQIGEYKLAAEANLQLALIEEMCKNLASCNIYLNNANRLIKGYSLDTLFGSYCTRRSSYYRFLDMRDSALFFAKEAIPYAKKFNHLHALADAYMLLGILSKGDSAAVVRNYKNCLKYFQLQSNNRGMGAMYGNLAYVYLQMGELGKAKAYSDSFMDIYHAMPITASYYDIETRSSIFKAKKQYDSALYYHTIYAENAIKEGDKQETKEIKKSRPYTKTKRMRRSYIKLGYSFGQHPYWQ